MKAYLLAFFSVCIFLPDALGAEGLALDFELSKPSYSLGEAVQVSARLSNAGDEALYLERPRTYGPDGIDIEIRRGECRYKVSPMPFDIPQQFVRLYYVPLFPGDRLEWPLLPVNEISLEGLLSLPLPGPGIYKINLSLSSIGDLVVGPFWPVWRGVVQSPEVEITFTKPSEETIRRYLGFLEGCLGVKSCDAGEAIGYFRLVRESRAADLLRKLIRKSPNDALLAEAVFGQGTLEDAKCLREVASREEVVKEHKGHYLMLAETIEKSSGNPCW